MKTKKKVVVGLSGGVDSSVAAALLKQQGYDVIGLYMNNWEDTDSQICPGALDWEDVVSVCGTLDIKHYSIKFNREYMDGVFSYFLQELKAGNTPNPDVLCNRKIKFGVFRDYAKKIGADYIATGHYCGLSDKCAVPFVDDSGKSLMRAFDRNKDQSYFLNQVTTVQFENVLFPLSDIDKQTVRSIAKKYNLSNSNKKDSTGICFIGERNFKNFLSKYLPTQTGKIVDVKTNKVIGEHSGLINYTIGQRRGLGIGGVKDMQNNTINGKQNGRWFVTKKDLQTNTLWVSQDQKDDLSSVGCVIEMPNIIGGVLNCKSFECTVKLRYRQDDIPAKIDIKDGCTVVFKTPQRAVTTGQYLVMYSGQRCLGGGRIVSVL